MVLMHLFMQEMIKKGEGRILNVSSVAAFQPTPFHSVYGATKAFVQNLSYFSKSDLNCLVESFRTVQFNLSYVD